MKNIKSLVDAQDALDKRVIEANKMLKNGKLTADFMAGFAEVEKVYADFVRRELFDDLMAEKSPRQSAVLQFDYVAKKHKVVKNKETKAIESIELVDKVCPITPDSFAKHMEDKDVAWKTSFEELRQMLIYKTMVEVGADTKSESLFIQRLARETAQGKTPVSNGEIEKAMLRAFDSYLGKDSGFKPNNHDRMVVTTLFASKGSDRLSIKTTTVSGFQRLMMTPMYRAMTNGVYSVGHKVLIGKKEAVTSKAKATTKTKIEAKETLKKAA